MPIYEYRCEDCQSDFEKLVLAGPKETVLCPRCGGERASRLVSTFGMVRGEGSRAEASSTFGGACCAGGGCTCRH